MQYQNDFFTNSWKSLKNSWNNNGYNKANEDLVRIIAKYNEISSRKTESNISIDEVGDLLMH